jgi:hypothetical protein
MDGQGGIHGAWVGVGEMKINQGRSQTTISKVKTQFGTMYVAIDTDEHGKPTGGNISTHRKEPDSQISLLVEELSDGLRRALENN